MTVEKLMGKIHREPETQARLPSLRSITLPLTFLEDAGVLG